MKESERIFCDEVARNCNAVPYPASIFAEEEAAGRHGYVKKMIKHHKEALQRGSARTYFHRGAASLSPRGAEAPAFRRAQKRERGL